MTLRPWQRTTTSAAGALLLTAALAVTAAPAAAAPRTAEPRALFPTDALTVRDARQVTGLRIALPDADCAGALECGLLRRLGQLDGFDLDPRLAIRFSRDVDPAEIAGLLSVEELDGGEVIGVDRVVHDPETSTVFAHPARQLAPATTYRLVLEEGTASGAARTTFTTMSATDGLLDLRRQIDSGRAMRVAGIRPGLRVEAVFPVGGAGGATVTWRRDAGPEADGSPVPTRQLPEGSRMVVGSYRAPNWLQADGTIRQTPTAGPGPLPISVERLPFVAVLPPGEAPAGGWPVAVFGHGLLGSTDVVGLVATANAARGIATIGTNVVGHGSGPRSAWEFLSGGTRTVLPAYGRGVDQDGDGLIGGSEGSSATGRASVVGSRDALRQTAADLMTLVRSLEGTDVDGDGAADLTGEGVTYAGQSFGGIYGTMLTGADPAIARAVLNVPGGPLTEVVRLAAPFRPSLARTLQAWELLDGESGPVSFDEQLPLRGQAPVTAGPEALAIQEYLARATWLSRSGSPEAFAPLIDPARVLLQVAFGDRTVPNPTTYTLADAGDLWERTSVYRNDRTPLAAEDPHAFLLGLGSFGLAGGQALTQATAFLAGGEVVDPDAAGDVWEVPVADPTTLAAPDGDRPAPLP